MTAPSWPTARQPSARQPSARRPWPRHPWTRRLFVAALAPLLALTPSLASAQDSWRAVPDLPTPRYGLAGTSAPCPKDVEGLKGTCVYAIGGQNDSPALDTVEAYSPATNTWRALPALPTARYALRATTAPCPKDVEGLEGTCVYAIGGFADSADSADVGTVEAYSPATNTWRALPALPTARSFAAAATAPCPKAVDGLKGSSCVYAVGGAYSDTVEAYSPVTNTWRTVPSLGTPRDAPAAATASCPEGVDGLKGTCLYAIGGFNPTDSILGTVEAYSPATNTWRTVASLGSPRVALGGTAAPCPGSASRGDRGPKQSCVYAIAGFTTFTEFATGSAEVLNPAENTWNALPALATPRFELGAATAPCPEDLRSPTQTQTCAYAFGGIGDPPFPTLGSVEALPVGG
ncbi:kelch repeat-containing protein [Streptomyces sp. NPDC091371]|uniref:Kelch repeat-containing protein n=1 Tax=Streptomyces sp. NPDC091371 TaxID=3155303 RepID=UPI00342C1428